MENEIEERVLSQTSQLTISDQNDEAMEEEQSFVFTSDSEIGDEMDTNNFPDTDSDLDSSDNED